MLIDSIFPKSMRSRHFWLVLTVAILWAASAVQAQTVTADFGGRNGATPVVPSGLFGIGGIGSTLSDQNAINTLTTAGLNQTSFWIAIDQIYATGTPDFSGLDRTLRTMQSSGVQPIATISGTPSSLGWSPCAPPWDVWRWGQMAASVVAHVNQNFPGLMSDYQIWNEPELPVELCVTDDTARLNSYLSIYAAAGAAMHAQAQRDGQPIRTGGPGISRVKVMGPVWVPALLSNPSTAPYVDFVSYHMYPTGQSNIDAGMTWSDLYAITQATNGPAYYYQKIEPLVRQGSQPNPASTPIYITEYNDNWAWAVDCCRNDPTYAPLWNSLVITDFLNLVYSGSTAVPSQLEYFASVGSYFCMLGQWDYYMDCNPATMDPYPQFYAYKLFASPDYLDLQSGGHMAASVSPASTTSWGLSATAFYTSGADSVAIINPTGTSYYDLSVQLQNAGLSSGTGTVYTLNRANTLISSQPVSVTSTGGGYSAQVAVPAYSTVAISVKGSGSTGGSGAPIAVLNVMQSSGLYGYATTYTADSSRSQGGGSAIVGRTIDFGDGSWVNWRPIVSHTYANSGSYKINLKITNRAGQVTNSSTVVAVQ